MHDVVWPCDMNYVRTRDAQKQLAQTSLRVSSTVPFKEMTHYNQMMISRYNQILPQATRVEAHSKPYLGKYHEILDLFLTEVIFILIK